MARTGRPAVHLAALVAMVAHLCAPVLLAQTPTADDSGRPQAFTLRTSFKASLLASHAPDAPWLFPVRDAAVSFWRVRVEPSAHVGERVTVTAAYEQRLRVFNQAPGLIGGTILPGDAPAAYRVRQLDWPLTTHDGFVWRHELDRASVSWRLPSNSTVTLGRQAIGWGRGVIFGAADLFAPFSPLEADREWRRGVDAIRVEVPLSTRASVEGVTAFGSSMAESVFAGRIRGYAGRADVEAIGGRRARDLFAGLTSSAAIGDAEVHAEAVLFRARDEDAAIARAVAKAVVGGSYRLALGPGVLTFVEYHYSGFGVRRADDLLTQLAVPAFRARVLRGDRQVLGRHAVAVSASTELSPEWALSGQWLQNATDGSGVAVPSATYSFGDTTSLLVSLYVPYGRPPTSGTLRSEYGTQGPTFFAQMRIYR